MTGRFGPALYGLLLGAVLAFAGCAHNPNPGNLGQPAPPCDLICRLLHFLSTRPAETVPPPGPQAAEPVAAPEPAAAPPADQPQPSPQAAAAPSQTPATAPRRHRPPARKFKPGQKAGAANPLDLDSFQPRSTSPAEDPATPITPVMARRFIPGSVYIVPEWFEPATLH